MGSYYGIMNKIIILLFFFNICFSQNMKVTYNYISKPDTVMVSQNTILYVEGSDSYFFSEAKYLSDSIIEARKLNELKTGIPMSFKNLPEDDVIYFLKKNNNLIEYYSTEFENIFKYSESIDFNWQIKDEFKELNGYKVQKATTNIFNRDFIAWFTESISINDGPYKFKGLPGLIVEIYDTNKEHYFCMVGLENKKMDTSLLFRHKSIEITKKKYQQYREQYKKDPFQKIKSLMMSTGIKEIQSKKGNTVNMAEIIAEREKKLLKKYKNDNQIEKIE